MKRLLFGCVLALVAAFASAVLLSVGGCGGADSSSPPTTVSRTEVRAGNGLIAFAHLEGGLGDISVVSPDGSGRAVLVKGGADELYPAWSPDGTKLAYTTDETPDQASSANGDIVVIDADGSNPVNVTDRSDGDLETDNWYPSWAPDGRQIAYMRRIATDTFDFESENEELPDIYVVNVDDSDRRNITMTPDVLEVAPEWSPSGSEIAFIRGDAMGQSLHLSVIDVDGSNSRELTEVSWPPMRGTNGYLPWIEGLSWSPDGTKIAFSDADYGDTWNVHVFVINADGTGRRDLTAGQPGSSVDPEWSPDGRQIAFVTDRDGDKALYVMDADGSNPQRITGSNSRVGEPDWQPIPRNGGEDSGKGAGADARAPETSIDQDDQAYAERFGLRLPATHTASPPPPTSRCRTRAGWFWLPGAGGRLLSVACDGCRGRASRQVPRCVLGSSDRSRRRPTL